jgi:hypothetical protein
MEMPFRENLRCNGRTLVEKFKISMLPDQVQEN